MPARLHAPAEPREVLEHPAVRGLGEHQDPRHAGGMVARLQAVNAVALPC